MAALGIPFERIPNYSPDSDSEKDAVDHRKGSPITESDNEVPAECRVPCSPTELSQSGRTPPGLKKTREEVVQLEEIRISERLDHLPEHGINSSFTDLFKQENMKELVTNSWSKSAEWPDFLNPARVQRPQMRSIMARMQANISMFFHNYVLLTLVITALGAILHPLAFITFFSIFFVYAVLFLYHENSGIQIGRLYIHEHGKSMVLLMFALCALGLTNSGPVMLILVGIALCSIVLHSSCMISKEELDSSADVLSPRTSLTRNPHASEPICFEDSVV
eukprot:CAMPEP_0185851086 /NCGR_PEP_ID=MMETSP1354-20130828/5587_1 /TAXON_ID=708628 /ORGANISM="Erythrolobus madagascarensis, Strain CCMP3276" /LENGTH=277 /DNA_ID=CAMNT_0028551891 /DNA_START=56 /DNA_END=889 /DNA_ORIENTATION=+